MTPPTVGTGGATAADRVEEVTFQPGEELMREGNVGFEMYVVVEGTAAISRGGHTVATVGPGDLVGEPVEGDRTIRQVTVTALSTLRAVVVEYCKPEHEALPR